MDVKQMLGVLLNTTEQQSQTTEKLLAALKGDIEGLNAATHETQNAASLISQSAGNAAQTVQKAVKEAVGDSMVNCMDGVSQTASMALETALVPILRKLSDLVTKADEAEEKLTRATASFGWKWAATASMLTVGAVVIALGLLWAIVDYQRGEVESLMAEKAQLKADVAILEKKGGRIKLNQCGPSGRLCVEITTNQGDGKGAFYGAWQDASASRDFVIPKGY